MYKCAFKELIGIPCPGCGITRALLSLICLDFKSALQYNPMIYCYIVSVVIYVILKNKSERKLDWLLWFNVILSIVVWLYRLVTGGLNML